MWPRRSNRVSATTSPGRGEAGAPHPAQRVLRGVDHRFIHRLIPHHVWASPHRLSPIQTTVNHSSGRFSFSSSGISACQIAAPTDSKTARRLRPIPAAPAKRWSHSKNHRHLSGRPNRASEALERHFSASPSKLILKMSACESEIDISQSLKTRFVLPETQGACGFRTRTGRRATP